MRHRALSKGKACSHLDLWLAIGADRCLAADMAALTHNADANCAETCLDIVSEAFVDVLTWLSDHAGAFLDSVAQVRRSRAL